MILIVDDQRDSGNALRRLLQHHGRDAVAVSDGDAAMARLSEQKISLVVLDANMPGIDGLMVLRTIRESTVPWKDVPVLMYSADTRPEILTEAKRLGAIDFIVKGSMSFDDFIAKIISAESK